MKKLKLRFHQIIVIFKYIFFLILCKILKYSNDDAWLISERGDEARDNGFSFYKYMEKNHKDLNFYYVINKSSSDLRRFKNKDRVIFQGSFKHYVLFLTAGYLLSTHIMGYSPEFRIFNKLDKWGLVKLKGKRIYLNHGIEQNNVSGLKYGNIKVDLFVCGGKKQYDFESKELGHPNGVVRYTGLARYDYLNNNSLKSQILLMPTWRTKLFYCSNIEQFKKSEYYKNIDNLLKSEKLAKFLNDNNLKLIFYPHYEIQPFLSAFTNYDKNIILADFDNYDVQTLINESKIMITDYSSVNFDFAYLNKPIIYYQFDYDDFMQNHFGEGYFKYKKDAFGPVVDNYLSVIDELINIVNNGYRVEEKYTERKNEFFKYNDTSNCERVYEAIMDCRKNY